MIGETFGRWTVIAAAVPKNGKLFVFCRCSCGTERVVRVGHLRVWT